MRLRSPVGVCINARMSLRWTRRSILFLTLLTAASACGPTAEEEQAEGACCVIERLCNACDCGDFENNLWVQNDDLACDRFLDARDVGCTNAEGTWTEASYESMCR